MTPDAADDASPSPEYSGGQEELDMTEEKTQQPASSDASPAQTGTGTGNGQKSSSNAKDPLRPRRKKARRACFACQRAHLTCGDERPCQRCIKRGLQDACHDGVRKKAKYLHDTPNEALMPGIGGNYHHLNGMQHSSLPDATPVPMTAAPLVSPPGFYTQSQPSPFDIYAQATSQSQMPPSMPQSMQGTPIMNTFTTQASPISPQFDQGVTQQPSPMQNIAGSLPQATQATVPQMQQYAGALFDPSDPALFNFDIASLNFGNQYGALEFSMLGQMSSGAAETPPDSNIMNSLGQVTNTFGVPVSNPSSYADGQSQNQNLVFGQDQLVAGDWQNNQLRHNSAGQILHTPQGTPITAHANITAQQDGMNSLPHAYAIGAGPSSLSSASPASNGQEVNPGYGNSPVSPAFFLNSNGYQQQVQQQVQQQPVYNQPNQAHVQPQPQPQQPQPQHPRTNITLATLANQNQASRKRRRDASAVYDSVKQPYPYTSGFHSLTAFLQSRFSPPKKMRIAKALASIRPSFISCTGSLDRDDLIFMEKCFQRTLWEYEDFINAYGTPTIICRRTGEVAAVSKEFVLLTGWKKDVLLGKEPNLNVNTGREPGASGNATGSNTRGQGTGMNTPRGLPGQEGNGGANGSAEPARPQPVFLAELLDDDSVIQFYEDFAKLAFGDSRGSAMAPCKLLKYKTKEDVVGEQLGGGGGGGGGEKPTRPAVKMENAIKMENTIANEADMMALGGAEGKIDCIYCWSVKRDVFEVPMLIVMNFLPVLQQNS